MLDSTATWQVGHANLLLCRATLDDRWFKQLKPMHIYIYIYIRTNTQKGNKHSI